MMALKVAAVAVSVALVLVGGRWLIRRIAYARPARPLPSLDHTETGLLVSVEHAILAAFAVLRSAGSIDSNENRVIFAVGPPPSAASAVDRAIHAEIARGRSFHEVRYGRDIQSMLAQEEALLRRQGFLLRLASRKWPYLVATATVAVAITVLSVGLYLADVPVWDGQVLIWGGAVWTGFGIPFLLLTIGLLGSTDSRSRAGRDALQAAWRRYPVSETVAPGRWLGGPAAAGMVVAIKGVGPIWKADPRFADQAGLPEVRRYGSNGDGGEGGESGDGGDDGSDGD